ncbi:PEGA domain-containing protein [Candidatus Daviesbacteria bacterium]|nr:PEGA domain-containing protein [Candidatus Daviesbacteria bacterium]
MRKVIFIILFFLSLVTLSIRFGAEPLVKMFKLEPRAGLRVESNIKAKVHICNKSNNCPAEGSEVGNTPYQDENLAEGEYLVGLKADQIETTDTQASASARIWQGYVKLNKGTLSVINRELGNSPAVSAGEVVTLDTGNGITIISIPNSADVIVDGKNIGRTPLTVTDQPAGEHQFVIAKEGYLKRSVRVNSVEGYNLTINVDLSLAEADLTKITTTPISATAQVVVRKTPTGFLRVRSAPSINGQEIARAKPGDVLILLEELPAWDRVRLPDGKEGYVSLSYVEKKK